MKKHKDYVITFGTEFSVMASQVFTYKLAAHFMKQEGFAEYAIARRAVGLIYPMYLLGLAVALPRHIARAAGQGDQKGVERYFTATLWIAGLATLLFSLLLNLFPREFAYLFFGQKHYANLIFVVDLVAISLVAHALAYGYFRGQMAFHYANALQLVNMAVVPPVVFIFFSKSVHMVLQSLGATTLAVAGTVLLFFTPWHQMMHRSFDHAKDLLRYGLRRIPGDFAMVALISLPAIVAAHLSTVGEAGMVAFGISVVNLAAAVVAPVGLILLPKVSRTIGQGKFTEMRREIQLIACFSALPPVGMIVLFQFMGPWLLRNYLGPEFQYGASIIQVLIFAALPLSFYSAMRSVLDAFHQRAVNTRNLVISLLVYGGCLLIGWWLIHAVAAVLWAFVAGTAVLGLLTFWELWKVLEAGRTHNQLDEAPNEVLSSQSSSF